MPGMPHAPYGLFCVVFLATESQKTPDMNQQAGKDKSLPRGARLRRGVWPSGKWQEHCSQGQPKLSSARDQGAKLSEWPHC